MTCNDCIHNEICQKFGGPFNINDADTSCTDFKDRSRFVELTSKVFVRPEGFCDFITAEIDGVRIKLSDSYSASIGLSEIGKTIFLSREEAEQALKERDILKGKGE